MSVADVPVPNAFRFSVEVQGLTVGWFTECGSLTAERALVEVEEGGVNNQTRQLPGAVSYQRVTLRGGLAGDALWSWFQEGQYAGDPERRNVTIVVHDGTGSETARWDILECLPLRWTGPALTAGDNRVAVEELELGKGEASPPSGTVQRVQALPPSTGAADPTADTSVDLDALALKVYDLLCEDLRIERQRLVRSRR
jgi:phage tail-like protein